MQPLNYCRQLLQYAQRCDDEERGIWAVAGSVDSFASKVMASVKFVMPEGVRALYVDEDLRGLERDSALHLPYPVMAVELPVVVRGQHLGRMILLAEESGAEIMTWIAFSIPAIGKDLWRPTDVRYVERENWMVDGEYVVRSTLADGNDYGEAFASYGVDAIVRMLNILACSNVGVSSIAPRRQPKPSKGAFQFDTYHVLTIGNSAGADGAGGSSHAGRSPREHLRRGHIRRLPTGKKIWINAMVVNPGVGHSVAKDYRVKGAV